MPKKRSKPKFSPIIKEFCKMMEDASKDYEWNFNEVNRMENLRRTTSISWNSTTLITVSGPRLPHSLYSAESPAGRAKIPLKY